MGRSTGSTRVAEISGSGRCSSWAPFAKSWSLNLVDDTIYTVLAQGCGGALSGVYSINIRDRHHPVVRQMLLSNTNTAGIWGRGGPVIGSNGRAYGSTADGPFDPIAGDYFNSVVAVSLRDLSLADYFTPLNWPELHRRDLDFGGASPVWFAWKNYNLLASGAIRRSPLPAGCRLAWQQGSPNAAILGRQARKRCQFQYLLRNLGRAFHVA